jgi:hypothetical protein
LLKVTLNTKNQIIVIVHWNNSLQVDI